MLTPTSPFLKSVMRSLRLYVEFRGRSGRTEFWSFSVFVFGLLVGTSMCLRLVAQLFSFFPAASPLIYGIILIVIAVMFFSLLLPSLSVTVRRLHDSGKPGIYVFLAAVPVIGAIALMYLMILPSETGANEYGPPPVPAG